MQFAVIIRPCRPATGTIPRKPSPTSFHVLVPLSDLLQGLLIPNLDLLHREIGISNGHMNMSIAKDNTNFLECLVLSLGTKDEQTGNEDDEAQKVYHDQPVRALLVSGRQKGAIIDSYFQPIAAKASGPEFSWMVRATKYAVRPIAIPFPRMLLGKISET
jgi:hypothetical protein